MNILVIGSGGREHAIVKSLLKNTTIKNMYVAPGNGGMAQIAQCVDIKATDIDGLVSFCVDKSIDLAVVAPDDPLVLGAVDALNKAGIKTFGPNKNAARIEGSKSFAKDFMKKYNIPTAAYEVFDDSNKAIDYLKNSEYPIVIKADGLALGKGVIIAQTKQEAISAIESIMVNQEFGESGKTIVIEEFLSGPEVSVLSFCDSKTIVPMVSAMDHKKALDNNQGLNTGGMGTIAPNPLLTDALKEECMQKIFLPTLNGLKEENIEFLGCIFFGLMLTAKGPYVIEYNCRFGDPETQVVLPLLKTDLLDIFIAIYNKELEKVNIEWDNKSCACVVMASKGYPVKYNTGYIINGLDKIKDENVSIYHAGTKKTNDNICTSGGRVLGISCLGDTLEKAINSAYEYTNIIDFTDKYFRSDIGKYVK